MKTDILIVGASIKQRTEYEYKNGTTIPSKSYIIIIRGFRGIVEGKGNMLILPIKKKWFDMILSGEKKEEYREIKPYYETRFRKLWGDTIAPKLVKRRIMFRNGYNKDSPSFIAECTCNIGTGKEEWGAEKGKRYYVLTIDRILVL